MIEKEIICAIDIGTTKIATLIAEMDEGTYNIIGIGESKSSGLDKGVIVDVDKTVKSINKSLDIAKKQAEIEIDTAIVGITGQHVLGINYHGVISIGSNNDRSIGQEINANDIDRVKDQARSIHLPSDRKILHVLNQEYVIDDKEGIQNPIGLSGSTLRSKVHLVTIDNNAERDLRASLEKSGLNVDSFVLEPLASAYSILDEHEMKLGVIVIDIGGGTSDMIVFKNNGVLHTIAIPYGGDSISTDLAYFLRCSKEEAERIKIEFGTSKSSLLDESQLITYRTTKDEKENNEYLKKISNVIEMRMREIFLAHKKELEKIKYDNSHSLGVVLTGGGSNLDNIIDLAREVFELPVRLGSPKNISGIGNDLDTPRYSTLLGLLEYYCQYPKEKFKSNNDVFGDIINTIKNFIKKLY